MVVIFVGSTFKECNVLVVEETRLFTCVGFQAVCNIPILRGEPSCFGRVGVCSEESSPNAKREVFDFG